MHLTNKNYFSITVMVKTKSGHDWTQNKIKKIIKKKLKRKNYQWICSLTTSKQISLSFSLSHHWPSIGSLMTRLETDQLVTTTKIILATVIFFLMLFIVSCLPISLSSLWLSLPLACPFLSNSPFLASLSLLSFWFGGVGLWVQFGLLNGSLFNGLI